MASLSSPGIGSGLDVTTLVRQLMALERAPLSRMNAQESSYNSKISAFGTLKSALDTLRTAAQALKDQTKVSGFTATVAETSLASATASSLAVAGTYSLEITSLSSQHKIASTTLYANASTAVTTLAPAEEKTLAVSIGTGTAVNVTINASNNTLSGVRDALNNSGAGVTATIVTGDSGAQLIITASTGGAGNTIKLSGVTELNYGDGVNPDQFTQKDPAASTSLLVDGNTVTATSRTITGAIDGVTLNLIKAAPGSPTTLTITRNPDVTTSVATAFVKAYNDLRTAINNTTKYDATTKTASPLTGDWTARNIGTDLASVLKQTAPSATGTFSRLTDLGISIDRSGVMSLNAATFQTAISQDFASVQSVLAGYGGALDDVGKKYVEIGGVLADRTNGLNSLKTSIANAKEAFERRMVAIEARYTRQFSALDTIVSRLQTTQQFLTQQIASLTNLQ